MLLSVTVDFKCTYLQFNRIISILLVSSPICKYHCKETHYPWSGYLTRQDLDWKERKRNNFQSNSQQPCFSNSSSSDVDWLWNGHKTYEDNNVKIITRGYSDITTNRRTDRELHTRSNAATARLLRLVKLAETLISTRLTKHKRGTRNGDTNNHIVEHHLQMKHQ